VLVEDAGRCSVASYLSALALALQRPPYAVMATWWPPGPAWVLHTLGLTHYGLTGM